ncbi:LysE family transporter [Limnohabitans parvus]|uniref:Lysine transporter LysE n=1 Tax=Limnohabitans parvus II-B4 TaxID=1293052 RepID=A0A315E9E9_9BURK|nr:LysE family transporter [Limnohabitans parvus]PUE54303.1 lysine transporter LysE [Limnohabitans parvus II-B4]
MFGISDYGAFTAAFVLLLFLPGPGNLALISSASKGGLSGGLASVLGLLLGDQVLLWLTVAGLAAVLQAFPPFFTALQWAGAAYLAWLGFKMLTAKPGEGPSIQISPGHYFRETMFITLLNPKAIMFYLAFFPQFIDPVNHQGWITFVAMAVTIAVLGFVYCFGVVLITHFMAERIRANPRVTGVLQKLAGLCLIGFGIKMVAK